MTGEVVLTWEELPIFLNRLPSTINLDYPFTGQQILTAEKAGKQYGLKHYLTQDDVDSFSRSELWDREKPRYSDYLQCFLACNLVTYDNMNEFREIYRTYSNIRAKVIYAPDTNLYYNRFLSTGAIQPEELLVVDSVQKEILLKQNRKFDASEIAELKNVVRYQKRLLEEFVNRRKKPSRKAANLALQEYRGHVDRAYAVAQSGELTRDKEKNDVVFIEAVKVYQTKSHTYPVVLTCDGLLRDVCDTLDVECFHFMLPRYIHPVDLSPEQLCNLICNLAGVLGLVKVNNVVVYGEFRGKGGLNEYKLRFLSGDVPLEIERDVEICRGLSKLDIDF